MPRKPRGWKVWVEPGGKNWRCRWVDRDIRGQEVFVLKDDAFEFEEKKRRYFERRDSGLPPILERKKVTVKEWANDYLSLRSKNPRKNTYRNDCDSINQFMNWVIDRSGNTDLNSVTESDVYLWKDWLYEENEYSHATVRNRLAHLKPAIKWAKKRGLIDFNFAVDVDMPKPTYSGRVLTSDEITGTVYALPPRSVVLAFSALLNSGMRKNEVLSLSKPQIEKLSPWRVHFQPVQTKNGKPKSVVLNKACQEAIGEALDSSKSDKVFDGLTKGILDYWMRQIQEKIGEVRLHDFKHTFCTNWMRETGDIYGLQKMTGNSLSSLRIYIHLSSGAPGGLDKFIGAPIRPLNEALEGTGT